MLAAYVVETVGPQDYTFTAEEFLGRLDESYGGERRRGGPPAPGVVAQVDRQLTRRTR